MKCPNCKTITDMEDLYLNDGRCPKCSCAMIHDCHYDSPEEDVDD